MPDLTSVSLCGVVLAGGASRRMGQPKAVLPVAGEPLLHRVVRLVGEAVPDVCVVGDPVYSSLVPGTPFTADAYPGRGPLGGLLTALRATSAPWLFLVACDMPLVRPALIRAMAEESLTAPDVDVVAINGPRGLEPLHAWYSRGCLPEVARQMARDEWSLQRLLARLRVREVSPDLCARHDPERRSTVNVNTPEEWARVRAEIERPLA